MDILLMGPPGAGKGTQGALLSERHRPAQVRHRRPPARRRRPVARPLGLQAKAVMEAGQLVSDDIILGVVREELDRPAAAGGVIFDGVVRTIPQAEGVAGLLAARGRKTQRTCSSSTCTDEEILGRIEKRRGHRGPGRRRSRRPWPRGCRAYREQTAPVLALVRGQRGALVRIPAVGPVDDIATRVRRALALQTLDDHPQVPPRNRHDGPRRVASWPARWRCSAADAGRG